MWDFHSVGFFHPCARHVCLSGICSKNSKVWCSWIVFFKLALFLRFYGIVELLMEKLSILEFFLCQNRVYICMVSNINEQMIKRIEFRRIGVRKKIRKELSVFRHTSLCRRLSPSMDKNHLCIMEKTWTAVFQKEILRSSIKINICLVLF